jgi:arabinofuranan 3-O-arabinosyltransferase
MNAITGQDPLRERLRTLACCLALAVLTLATRPGRIIADTKVDMVVDPVGFLGRSLHLWDTAQAGQLQNQAVGYLFPMGPFYAVGDLVGLPAWITQRLWLTLLLCVAFLGVRRIARELGMGGPVIQLTAGMVYALAPSGLSTLGQISSEYLPYAMLPWILLPLMHGTGLAAAARSGLAVACCGGINAAATVAVLVVPGLYLLTRPRGTPRLRTGACWTAAVAVATGWWLVPLLLTGRYAFSWLPFTEKAAATTGTTGLVNILRGTERWTNFVAVDGQLWWPVGHALAAETFPVLCTAVVAGLGLVGLLHPGLPERRFLLLTILTGVVVISTGHMSGLESPLAAPMRELLDGVLAPFRNLHKFDALVRLPLALGVAWLLAALPDPRGLRAPSGIQKGLGADRRGGIAGVRSGMGGAATGVKVLRRVGVSAWRAVPGSRRVAAVWPGVRGRAVVACAALGGVCVTVLSSGGLAGPGDFQEVPKYWRDAATWLNARDGRHGVLAVPGAAFGQYVWGRPMDEMTQPLLTGRWAVRQLVPAGSPGYTRALDAIDQRVNAGQGSPGLAEHLGRMGIRYLLVRNDLQRSGLRGGWPARIHQALDTSPGLRRVAEFGEFSVGQPFGDAVSSIDQRYPALEVYEVGGARPIAELASTAEAVRLYGSPEALLALADEQALHGRPVLLNDEAPDLGGVPVTADTLRAVRRNFGELQQTSPTQAKAGPDVVVDGWERYATTVAYTGFQAVMASGSPADADSIPQQYDPGKGPYAALDGDERTSWETGTWAAPMGQWLRVEFQAPIAPGAISVEFARDEVARVAVETEQGTLPQDVQDQMLRVPPGPTNWLKIRILELVDSVAVPEFARAGITDLKIPGVTPDRTYRLPATPTGAFILTRPPGAAAECMKGSAGWVCSSSLERGDEEGNGFDRTFPTTPRTTTITGSAIVTDPALIDRHTDQGVQITAAPKAARSAGRPAAVPSSDRTGPVVWPGVVSGGARPAVGSEVGHPAAQARAAFDGDRTTTWIADEESPTLTLTWDDEVEVDSLTVRRPPSAGGPLRVSVSSHGGEVREGLLDRRGRLAFAPLTTKSLTLTFQSMSRTPPQITEITLPSVPSLLSMPNEPVNLPCGQGPTLELNGATIKTKATGTQADLLEARPLRFEACAPLTLTTNNRLRSPPASAYRVTSALIDPTALPAASSAPSTPVAIREWTQESRQVEVTARAESFLVVNENFNSGWHATVHGKKLRPLRLDGWKQAWLIPAGTSGTVTLTYPPGQTHRAAVFTGLALLPLLLLAARPYPARAPTFRPPTHRTRLRRPPPSHPVRYRLPASPVPTAPSHGTSAPPVRPARFRVVRVPAACARPFRRARLILQAARFRTTTPTGQAVRARPVTLTDHTARFRRFHLAARAVRFRPTVRTTRAASSCGASSASRATRSRPASAVTWRAASLRPGAVLVASVLGFWLAGPPGVLVTGGAAAVFGLRGRTSIASYWLVAVLMILGASWWAVALRYGWTRNPLAPSGLLGDLLPQLLGLLIVARLVVAVVDRAGREGERSGW